MLITRYNVRNIKYSDGDAALRFGSMATALVDPASRSDGDMLVLDFLTAASIPESGMWEDFGPTSRKIRWSTWKASGRCHANERPAKLVLTS